MRIILCIGWNILENNITVNTKNITIFYNPGLSDVTSGNHFQGNNPEEGKSNIHVHCNYHSRNIGDDRYYLFGIYYDTLHTCSLILKKPLKDKWYFP